MICEVKSVLTSIVVGVRSPVQEAKKLSEGRKLRCERLNNSELVDNVSIA